MYLDDDPARRFLIADEVGLGKTLVARGLIARVIDHLWDRTSRIDIIYICSNADIARQNINRLNVTGEKDFALASRITLLPLGRARLADERLNFVSFTPGTSFDLKKKGGMGRERALLHRLLTRALGLRGAAPLNVLRGSMSAENFRGRVERVGADDLDESVAEAFAGELTQRPEVRRSFEELCDAYPRSDSQPDEEIRARRSAVVGELRSRLAQTCLRSLQPDLIILDEFQRFKHLLDTKNAAGQLADHLFTYQQNSAAGVNAARVLLLSATPYKMYTMDEESTPEAGDGARESHYEDFWRTLRFLEPDGARIADCAKLFEGFRTELNRVPELDRARVADIKTRIEGSLRRVMVRTERLAVTEDRNGMLDQISPIGLRLEARDLEQYLMLQRVSRAIGAGDSLEYWKSGSYILNLTEDYDLKRRFDKAWRQPRQAAELGRILGTAGSALLSLEDIERYARVDPGNARLRSLEANTIEQDWWRLLWAPPALPYYQGGGAYGEPKTQAFTKRLVFSCWRVVPKVIASLLSYEAERRMIRSFEEDARNTTEARKGRRRLLTFSRSEGRLTGMPVLGLVYPAEVLARRFDPLALGREMASTGTLPTFEAVLARVKADVATLLDEALPPSVGSGSQPDESWHWAAPMLLDRAEDPARVDAWFAQGDLATLWAGQGDEENVGEEGSLWAEHVDQARKVLIDPSKLGPRPPDLADVLALLAVAGPGVAALRALARVTGGLQEPSAHRRRHAAPVAHAFLHLSTGTCPPTPSTSSSARAACTATRGTPCGRMSQARTGPRRSGLTGRTPGTPPSGPRAASGLPGPRTWCHSGSRAPEAKRASNAMSSHCRSAARRRGMRGCDVPSCFTGWCSDRTGRRT